MTGMRNRMSVARCCCECEDCCNENAPAEFDAVLSLGNAYCLTCDTLVSGTYTLAHGACGGLAQCTWIYQSSWFAPPSSPTNICSNEPYEDTRYILFFELLLSIRCYSATQYLVRASVIIRTQSGGSFISRWSDIMYFSSLINRSEWECNTAVDTCLPITSHYYSCQENSCGRNIGGLSYPAARPCGLSPVTPTPICDSTGATVCLTAVP